jgi:exonuclease VII large subunit
MFNLESSDTYLNQFDLEFFNSITLEIDEFNDSFSNATYLTTNDNKDLTTNESSNLTTNDNKDLTTTSKKRIRQNKINSASRKKQKITNASKDLTTTSKKRIRQNKINSASRKCRQKQKIKSKLMESYIIQVNENINKLYTSLENVNMLEVMTRIYQMTADMNDYSENIIKEVNKI